MQLLEPTLSAAVIAIPRGIPLYADKGYDSAHNRRICHTYGMYDRIFRRRTMNGRRTHAKRGVVERFFAWMDKYRRLILRYEKQVAVYESMTYFASGILLQARL
jgi:transposase